MKRLRFFRVLLPVLLIPFLVIVVLQIKTRPKPLGRDEGGTGESTGAMVEGVRVADFEGTALRLFLSARTTTEVGENHVVFEDVERLELGRADASPLILSADRAGDRPNQENNHGNKNERTLRIFLPRAFAQNKEKKQGNIHNQDRFRPERIDPQALRYSAAKRQ